MKLNDILKHFLNLLNYSHLHLAFNSSFSRRAYSIHLIYLELKIINLNINLRWLEIKFLKILPLLILSLEMTLAIIPTCIKVQIS